MNHNVPSGYLVIDVERLRKPMQQITDFFLRCMEVQESATVIEMPKIKMGVTHEETA